MNEIARDIFFWLGVAWTADRIVHGACMLWRWWRL